MINSRISDITAKIRRLEDDLELEFALRRLELAYTVRDDKVRFEEYVLLHHKQLRSRFLSYVLGARPLSILTAPPIYAMIVRSACLMRLLACISAPTFPYMVYLRLAAATTWPLIHVTSFILISSNNSIAYCSLCRAEHKIPSNGNRQYWPESTARRRHNTRRSAKRSLRAHPSRNCTRSADLARAASRIRTRGCGARRSRSWNPGPRRECFR